MTGDTDGRDLFRGTKEEQFIYWPADRVAGKQKMAWKIPFLVARLL